MKKTIIITGSEGQLGLKMQQKLREKYNLVLIDKIKKKKRGYFQIDLSDINNLEKKLKFLSKKIKSIDILINNAAVQYFEPFENRNLNNIIEMVNVNLIANIILTKFVFNNFLKKQEEGKIINIGSIYGLVAGDMSLYKKGDRRTSETYAATKAGTIQITKYFASYFSKYNILVNSISPGGIENRKKQKKNFIKKYAKKTLLGRMAKSNEIMHLIEYLISDKCSYTTGENFIIDGGYLAR